MATEAEKVRVFDALAKMDPDMLLDNAGSFSCVEAEAIASFISLAHGDFLAGEFRRRHAIYDDTVDDLHTTDGSLREENIVGREA